MATIGNIIIGGNVDIVMVARLYRLFNTPAGSVPLDRNYGIDTSCLDSPLAATEGALLVEYTKKLKLYYPSYSIKSLTFSVIGSTIQPQVVIQYNG